MSKQTLNTQSNSYLPFILLILISLLAIACTQPPTLALDTNSDYQSASSEQTLSIQGKVISVLDGDTIEVLDTNRTTFRIRLQGIDAPEKSQPFGARARQQLSNYAFNRDATIHWNEKDVYGRIIGKVLIDNRDICLKMIVSGLAWHFKRYENSQSEADRVAYAEAEHNSRQQRIGLWADQDPTPPWTYRHQRSENQKQQASPSVVPDL